jgi:hypothetical protein
VAQGSLGRWASRRTVVVRSHTSARSGRAHSCALADIAGALDVTSLAALSSAYSCALARRGP